MIRVNQCEDDKAAKGYYTRGDYYAADRQELPGIWGGKAAGMLGLAGRVSQRAFDRLCGNLHPVTGQKLTPRMRKDRTPGYDLNFHACKSVSILYGLTGNAAILAAFRGAVRQTMQAMEAEMKTRVRRGGRYQDRKVGNMAWAEYVHLTARPVRGVIDPHLHAHCFAFNCVFDQDERRWKAGKFDSIQKEAPRFEAMFHRLFGRRLAELGIPIAWNGDRFEIAGIDRATIETYSLRTAQINQVARKWGITDPAAKDRLGAITREYKRRDVTLPELRREWRARLTDAERIAFDQAMPRRQPELTAWEDDRRHFVRQRQRQATQAEAALAHGMGW